MRAKTLVELLTLSTNLYMISKDEEFMKNLSELVKKGRTKAGEILDGLTGNGEDEEGDDEEKLLHRLLLKMQKAREDLEKQIEEKAAQVYKKMKIAHSDEIRDLREQIEKLKTELALTEARLVHLEPKRV